MRFPLRSALLCFLGVLISYLVFYYGIEKSRKNPGSWEVTFLSPTLHAASSPGVQIHHSSLPAQGVTLFFPGETLLQPPSSNIVVRFDRPRTPVPFGTNVFDDLMFLPGVVVLQLFGHEVQLAPRTLVINRREVPWTLHSTLSLYPSNRLSEAQLKPASTR